MDNQSATSVVTEAAGQRFKLPSGMAAGQHLYYTDTGQGEVMLFLHGIPASGYLWRKILPDFVGSHRCLVPDLMGMGQSDKPGPGFTVFEHVAALEAWLVALDLQRVTLVLHGWGSVIGLALAQRQAARIAGLVFFEAHLQPIEDWSALSLPMQHRLYNLGDHAQSRRAIIEDNYFLTHFLPKGVLGHFTEADMAVYQAPFATQASREILWQYFQDLPQGKQSQRAVVELMQAYRDWLVASDLPKLLLYAVPGFVATIEQIVWAKEHLSNLTLTDLGEALHFAMESNPEDFSKAIQAWQANLG